VPARALDGDPQDWHARVGGGSYPIRRTYAEVDSGSPIALVNSYGLVEVAIRDGSAAGQLGVQLGEPFEVLHLH
jgi:S-adenosylmethionine hydrolase